MKASKSAISTKRSKGLASAIATIKTSTDNTLQAVYCRKLYIAVVVFYSRSAGGGRPAAICIDSRHPKAVCQRLRSDCLHDAVHQATLRGTPGEEAAPPAPLSQSFQASEFIAILFRLCVCRMYCQHKTRGAVSLQRQTLSVQVAASNSGKSSKTRSSGTELQASSGMAGTCFRDHALRKPM